jgi:hypothetical protein
MQTISHNYRAPRTRDQRTSTTSREERSSSPSFTRLISTNPVSIWRASPRKILSWETRGHYGTKDFSTPAKVIHNRRKSISTQYSQPNLRASLIPAPPLRRFMQPEGLREYSPRLPKSARATLGTKPTRPTHFARSAASKASISGPLGRQPGLAIGDDPFIDIHDITNFKKEAKGH